MPLSHERGTTTKHSVPSADSHGAPRTCGGVVRQRAKARNTALILLLEHARGRCLNPDRTLSSTIITPCWGPIPSGKCTERQRQTMLQRSANTSWSSRGDVWVLLCELGTTAATVSSRARNSLVARVLKRARSEQPHEASGLLRDVSRLLWKVWPRRHQSQQFRLSTSAQLLCSRRASYFDNLRQSVNQ